MQYSKSNAGSRQSARPSFFSLVRYTVCISLAALAFASTTVSPQKACAQDTSAVQARLVPQPERVTLNSSPFVLTPATQIVYVPAEGMLSDANLLAGHLRSSTGYPIRVVSKRAGVAARRGAIVLTTTETDPELGPQGYQLDTTKSNVIIRASNYIGVFYGAQTLRQLLPIQIESPTVVHGVSWQVPGVDIWDRPRYAERGIMLDSSRHMQSVDFIKRTIDRMAYQKMNMFHWHLTDDDGWRIEIKQYPNLMTIGAYLIRNGKKTGGYYTQDQIRDIVAFALARGVTIVPEMDMPGHSSQVLASYPELGCTNGPYTNTQWNPGSLCPGKEATYTFIDNVLTEVMSLFPSKTIHIGGDEVDTSEWSKSPDCQAMMQKERLADLPALKDYFTDRVAQFLSAHGRRMEKWTDKTDGDNVAPDSTMEEWNEPDRAMADVKNHGDDVVIAAVQGLYYDYGVYEPSMETVYNFDPNIYLPGMTPDLAQHMLGVEACLWTADFADDASCDVQLWPRMIPLSILGWSQPSSKQSWSDFKGVMLDSYYPRLALLGLGAPEPADRVLHDLNVRSGFDWGVKIGSWTPDTFKVGDTSVDYDITHQLQGDGIYLLKAAYTSGPSGILVDSVDLVKNGQVIATYKLPEQGWAGAIPRWTTFQIPMSAIDPQAQYAARIHYSTDEGHTNTAGDIWLQGPD